MVQSTAKKSIEFYAGGKVESFTAADLQTAPRAESVKAGSFAIVPKVEYIDYLSKHCRAAYNAAKVLSLLVYRCQRNRPGERTQRLEVVRQGGRWGAPAYWWLHTRKEIADECGLTEDQVRRAVETLVKTGLVAARQGRHPVNGEVPCYRGKTVWHLRLGACQRGKGLTGWPTVADLVQMRIVLDGDKSPLINGEQSPTLLPDTLEDLDSTKGKVKDFATEKNPSVADLQASEPGKVLSGQSGTVKPDNPSPVTKGKHPPNKKLASDKEYWDKFYDNPSFLSEWRRDQLPDDEGNRPFITHQDCLNAHVIEDKCEQANLLPWHLAQFLCFHWDDVIKRDGPDGDCPPNPDTDWVRAHIADLIRLCIADAKQKATPCAQTFGPAAPTSVVTEEQTAKIAATQAWVAEQQAKKVAALKKAALSNYHA